MKVGWDCEVEVLREIGVGKRKGRMRKLMKWGVKDEWNANWRENVDRESGVWIKRK